MVRAASSLMVCR